MTRLLWRASWRHLTAHPWQLALTLLGVALGVAVVVAIDLAVSGALRSFEWSSQVLTGRATHQVLGGPAGLSEQVYARLRLDVGLRDSAPIVTGEVRPAERADMTLQVLGVDPFAEGAFRPYATGGGEDSLSGLLTEPGAMMLTSDTAARLDLHVGATLSVRVAGQQRAVILVGTLASDELTAQGLTDVMVMDIAGAQNLLGRSGTLSRIDVALPIGPAGEAMAAQLRALLPHDAVLLPATAVTQSLTHMTDALRFNLQAMSLLALLVGMFLIYNAAAFSVVQRRPAIGTLRALGVTRGEIYLWLVLESCVVATLGLVLGWLLGALLGQGLLQAVVNTINDLYFSLTVSRVALEPQTLLKSAVLGIGAAVVASLRPAWEAAASVPRALRASSLETTRRARLPQRLLVGAGVIGVGGVSLVAPGQVLWPALVGVLAMVAGYAWLVPAATVGLMALLRPIASVFGGYAGRMATRGVTTHLSRTGVAVAALAVAVSATLGVGLMIGSFRHTVDGWLQHILRADVYVAATAGAGLPPELITELRAAPSVVAVSTGRRIQIQEANSRTEVWVLDPAPASRTGFRYKHGDPTQAWQAFAEAGAALVSESYAFRQRVGVGDTLRLRSDAGVREFAVAGVYYDYGSDQGVVALHRATYDRYWRDRVVASVGLYLEEGAEVAATMAELRDRVGAVHEVVLRSNRELRAAAMQVFDRTFVVTDVLRLLAVLIAGVGVVGALAALQLERGREVGVWRALGFTAGQVGAVVTGESLCLGLAAGVLAVPLGWVLALVMVHVIQPRGFGWTMSFVAEPILVGQALALSVTAALCAGLWPAWRMARAVPAAALRGE